MSIKFLVLKSSLVLMQLQIWNFDFFPTLFIVMMKPDIFTK